jgi:hypothetical protein
MFAANTEEEEEEEEDNNDSPMKAAYYQLQQENPDFPFVHDMCAFYAQEWLEEYNDVAKVSAMLREKQAAIDKLQLEFLNVSRKYLFEFLVDMGGSADEVAAMLREKLANPRFSQIVAATEWSDHGSDFDDRSEWSDSDGDDDDDHFHNDDKSEAFNALLRPPMPSTYASMTPRPSRARGTAAMNEFVLRRAIPIGVRAPRPSTEMRNTSALSLSH